MEASVFDASTPAARSLDELLARDAALPPHFLRNTARAYLDSASRQERMVWALRCVQAMPLALRFLRERVEFVVQTKALTDLGVRPRSEMAWLAEFADARPAAQKVFSGLDDVSQPKVARFVEQEYGSTFRLLEEDLNLAEEALSWLAQPGAREHARTIAQHLFRESASEVLPSVNKVRRAESRIERKKDHRHIRGAIKKSLALLSRFGRQREVQLLVSGQRAVLSHPDSPFKLELVPHFAGWLEERTRRPGGSAPFEIHLLTKDNVQLSRLCVLFADTPVLDQLLALSLYVDTGNEMELLEKANWFGVSNEGQTRSLLETHAPNLLKKLPTCGPAGARSRSIADLLGASPEERTWAPFRAPVSQWVSSAMDGLTHRVARLSAAYAGTPALA